jgi:hypothetical protein
VRPPCGAEETEVGGLEGGEAFTGRDSAVQVVGKRMERQGFTRGNSPVEVATDVVLYALEMRTRG